MSEKPIKEGKESWMCCGAMWEVNAVVENAAREQSGGRVCVRDWLLSISSVIYVSALCICHQEADVYRQTGPLRRCNRRRAGRRRCTGGEEGKGGGGKLGEKAIIR